MGSLYRSIPEKDNKRLSLPLQCKDEVERIKQYPVKLMQHQEEPALQLIQKINQIIANHSTPVGMLQEIAQVLGAAFRADCCSLVTLLSEVSDDTITANWYTQEYLELSHQQEMLLAAHVDLPVVHCVSEPLTIDDISTIGKVIEDQYLPIPIKAVLAIICRFGGKNNGVISLVKSQPYDWNEQEKQLLKAMESSCAIAFAQVLQAQMIASQDKELLTCCQHQSLIKQLTVLNRSGLELNQMLQLTITSTAEALQADRGLLMLLKYTNPLHRIRQKNQIPKAKATVVGEWSKETKFSSEEHNSFWLSECGLCQRAFTESEKLILLDGRTERDASVVAPVFALEVLPTVLLIPLETQGKVLGFLVLQQAVARRWQPAELNMVEMVCAQVSNAIIQTQTLKQVQTLVDERTAQLQGSLEVQARLYERTRQYVEQLRELNHLKDEFVSNMSDRLRYPLTNMRMALRNLRQPGITPERHQRYMNILEEECTKEINLINDLLTLQQLENQPEPPQFVTIDLNSKIKELAASFEQIFAERGLKISLYLPNETHIVQTEVKSFNRILQELFTNAVKHSEQDTIVQLEVSHQVHQQIDQVMMKLTNVGHGISEEEAAYIFDRFRRGKGRWTPGTGLGLALVKSLTQHLNGTISVESIPIEGSHLSKICFSLTLPQYSDESNPYSESD
jgi:signal transduction histidine kinase